MKLPQAFEERMRLQLGPEADEFFDALDHPAPVSIRLNHFKGRSSFPLVDQVKWCNLGYYLNERPAFHLDPHWHGGAYYVQEASSMILDHVIQQLAIPERAVTWLDMCAAPGGKTGILAKHMRHSDVLVANEVIPQRRSILYENMVKGGFLNAFITGERTAAFPENFADIILIDAPCAGEGMMRKEPEAVNQWTPKLVEHCAAMQREIFKDAVKTVKPGGYIIYSTCSYSMQENLNNAAQYFSNFDVQNIELRFPDEFNVSILQQGTAAGYQLYPHRVKGEGLFVTVFKRNEGRVNVQSIGKKSNFTKIDTMVAPHIKSADQFLNEKNSNGYTLIHAEAEESGMHVRRQFPGAELISTAGEVKGKDFIPSHFLAMSIGQSDAYMPIHLNHAEALDFLQRNTDFMPATPGWYVATYEATQIGWLKRTPQGWKNHYPMYWRLRQRS